MPDILEPPQSEEEGSPLTESTGEVGTDYEPVGPSDTDDQISPGILSQLSGSPLDLDEEDQALLAESDEDDGQEDERSREEDRERKRDEIRKALDKDRAEKKEEPPKGKEPGPAERTGSGPEDRQYLERQNQLTSNGLQQAEKGVVRETAGEAGSLARTAQTAENAATAARTAAAGETAVTGARLGASALEAEAGPAGWILLGIQAAATVGQNFQKRLREDDEFRGNVYAWLILIATFPLAIFIGFVAPYMFAKQGNSPLSNALNPAAQLAGERCSAQFPTLDLTRNGKTVHLTISTPSGSGKFSYEDSVSKLGGADKLALWSYGTHTQADQDYYVTMRAPYVAADFGEPPASDHQSRDPKLFPGLPSPSDYAGVRIVIYNPANGKAVLGTLLEYGPAPWTGISGSKNQAFYKQQALWNAGSRNGFRIEDPVGYEGRVVGGPPTLAEAIGATADTPVTYGFAPASLQNATPGPLPSCTPVKGAGGGGKGTVTGKDVVNDGTVNNHGAVHLLQNVPAIRQATDSQCNRASVAMVVAYYAPSQLSQVSATDSHGHVVNSQETCLSHPSIGLRDGLAGVTDKQGKPISFKEVGSLTTGQVKQSIDNGDPVIVNSKDLYSSGNHFTVIVGYDDATFYINDPFPWDSAHASGGTIHVSTNKGHTSSHTEIAQQALIDSLTTENTSGYVAAIRQ